METGVVENHDGQLVCRSVTGEFVDEGDHMGALDALLDQLKVQCALLLAPDSQRRRLAMLFIVTDSDGVDEFAYRPSTC